MTIRERVQEELKSAMKNKDKVRLECLRLMKAALLLKEKETGKEPTDEEAAGALRKEVRKRHESIAVFREHGREEEARAAENEIGIIEEFLPKQLSPAEIEERVRAFLAAHPEVNHPGKLTGLMKKELGDLADGKTLNEVCKKALEG